MANRELVKKLYDDIWDMPLVDLHTHLDADHLAARGLHDILLYHMVISDLYAAGCPDGDRLSEEPTEEEALYRLERAIPYVKHIRGTSCYWGVRIILEDLYGWTEELNEDNWRECHELIKSKGCGAERAKEIAKMAKIEKSSTELWRAKGHKHDDMLMYSLEWAFFCRDQWGINDAALLELEHAWNEEIPGPPLPIGIDPAVDCAYDKKIKTIDDVKAAVQHYVDHIDYDKVFSNASHFSTTLNYHDVTEEDMIKALENRENAGEWERDVYANYINTMFLDKVQEIKRTTGKEIIIQYSLGAEPLPHETGSYMRPETIFELAKIIHKYSDLKFEIHVASLHADQAWCTLCRELPNLKLDGFWWHNFFPTHIRRIISERMDMLPSNNIVGFFTDAYCMDWCYAKAKMITVQYAEVVAQKIEMGQFDYDTAIGIVRATLDVDRKFFKLDE